MRLLAFRKRLKNIQEEKENTLIMETKVCLRCHRLFQYVRGIELCTDCKSILEDKFQEVQEYILEKRSASITQISRECEVPMIQLKEWLNEDRLELAERIYTGLVCEKCGQDIYEGNFCYRCKMELLGKVGNALRKEEPKVSERQSAHGGQKMRFIRH